MHSMVYNWPNEHVRRPRDLATSAPGHSRAITMARTRWTSSWSLMAAASLVSETSAATEWAFPYERASLPCWLAERH